MEAIEIDLGQKQVKKSARWVPSPVVWASTGRLLKRYKDDVKEVAAGMDCGLNIENFNDIKVGDIIEGYTEKEVARKL